MQTLPKNCYLCARPTSAELGSDWILDRWSGWIVCPDCIREGRALRADPAKQNCGGLAGPILAFWDQTRLCGMCSTRYVFSAEEQRFWYETLQFFVESAPLQCQDCRRVVRQQKAAQRTLQRLLPLAPDAHWRLIEEVARAAADCGAKNAREYLQQAKNRCDDPAEKARLTSDIATLNLGTPLAAGGCRSLVEQLKSHYRKKAAPNTLSDEDRANLLKAPGLARDRCELVARIDGMWVRPVPDVQDPRQLAYLEGESICPNVPPHIPKVMIDAGTGVLLYLPHSGTWGQTGHFRMGDDLYGPPGTLPWV